MISRANRHPVRKRLLSTKPHRVQPCRAQPRRRWGSRRDRTRSTVDPICPGDGLAEFLRLLVTCSGCAARAVHRDALSEHRISTAQNKHGLKQPQPHAAQRNITACTLRRCRIRCSCALAAVSLRCRRFWVIARFAPLISATTDFQAFIGPGWALRVRACN